MSNFKILNHVDESSYFKKGHYDEYEESYYNQHLHFSEERQVYFLNELQQLKNTNKQAGYSKSRQCNYVSVLLVAHCTGDGEFTGHDLQLTYLIDEFNIIADSSNIKEVSGEIGYSIRHVYHALPDGKLIEFSLESTYRSELESIYKTILTFRHYYDLSNQLPEKETIHKKHKI